MTAASSKIQTPSRIIHPEDISIEDLSSLGQDSLPIWALSSGIEVDNNPVDFDHHRYLLPIYMDHKEREHTITWLKGAQLGATAYQLLRALWWLEHHQGRKAGFYFPTNDGVQNLSKDRLGPMIDSCPSIKAISSDSGKLNLKNIGKSSFYLYHLGGVASKDSVPMDYLVFDEVRLVSPKDIDQTLHRIAHSPYKMKTFMSTAGAPNADIHARFLRGTQLRWRAKCGCPDGMSPALTFPDCIVTDDSKRPGEVYIRCPKCRYTIHNPQNGRYIAGNPGADHNSYAVSQLCSHFRSTGDIWEEYTTTTNKEEFYNAALGVPYIDAANRGVTLSELQEAVNPEIKWAANETKKERKATKTSMGIDQGGRYNYVVIADINPDGSRKRIRHLEVIESTNPEYFKHSGPVSPFVRCEELMEEYNVGICVVDGMPNVNEALAFAQKFPRKVFLASYSNSMEAAEWHDKGKVKASVAKAGPLLRFKYRVTMGRFASLSMGLAAWRDGNVEIPPIDHLRQMIISVTQEHKGKLRPEATGDRLFLHLPRLIKRWKELDEATGEGTWRWEYAGGAANDPHFAHAWNYCNVGLERLRRHVRFSFL